MSTTRVRKASRADARAIASIHVRAWQSGYRELLSDTVLDGLSVEERERFWRELVGAADARSFTLVAELDAAVAGFCSVAAPSRDEDAGERTCEVAAIYVEPDAWRSGVGRALLTAALETARKDGWSEVTLWVLAGNIRARAFYTGYAFEPDGAEMQDEEIGQSEVRLRLALRP